MNILTENKYIPVISEPFISSVELLKLSLQNTFEANTDEV